MRETFQITVRRACRLAGFSRAAWDKKSSAEDQPALRLRLRELAMARPRFGCDRVHIVLRREGWHVNEKRVRRLCRLEGLHMRMRVRRRKRMALHRGPASVPTCAGERWSMDFVHDQLFEGRLFRVRRVVDQLTRQSPTLECEISLTGRHVVAVLDKVGAETGLPVSITVDEGTELMSKAVEAWAFCRGVPLDFTRPGKPTDESHIESLNGRLCDACLNVHQFLSLSDAKARIEAWRQANDQQRPLGSLGQLTPDGFASQRQQRSAAEPAPSQHWAVCERDQRQHPQEST
jgi:putative transposase